MLQGLAGGTERDVPAAEPQPWGVDVPVRERQRDRERETEREADRK